MALKHLTEGFSPGSALIVRGYVGDDVDRFEVNLQCGPLVPPDIVSDIALHINPRFDEDIIVRNSKSNGFWGCEEREGGLYFSSNQEFILRIYSEHRGYRIIANDYPFIYYKHRQDLSFVSHMSACGDVIIKDVIYKPTPAKEEFYVPKPSSPYKFIFNGCFKTDSSIQISGRVRGEVDRFTVNFVSGKHPDGHSLSCLPSTIALHFNVRFDDHTVVRNSMINGEWGTEELDDILCFSREMDFFLKVVCREHYFEIYVDNILYTTYRHRVDPNSISYVYIHGAIYVFEVFHM